MNLTGIPPQYGTSSVRSDKIGSGSTDYTALMGASLDKTFKATLVSTSDVESHNRHIDSQNSEKKKLRKAEPLESKKPVKKSEKAEDVDPFGQSKKQEKRPEQKQAVQVQRPEQKRVDKQAQVPVPKLQQPVQKSGKQDLKPGLKQPVSEVKQAESLVVKP